MIWAIALAVHQPLMQPDPVMVDPTTHETYVGVASNNTYWPRDIRQFAILLALVGVIVICRAKPRGIAVGAAAALLWFGADLWLDRVDVAGKTTATWLAIAAATGFAAIATAAARMPKDQPASAGWRQVIAGSAAGLAAAVMVVTTPWEEPVVDPDKVAVENTLTLFQVVLAVMFMATAAGVVAELFARDRAWVAAGLAAVAVVTALVGSLNGLVLVGLVAAPLAVPVAVGAPPRRLVGAAIACLVAVFPVVVAGAFFVGAPIGGAMTWLAGNPPVNGADTDLPIAVAGLVVTAVLAVIAHQVTRPRQPVETLSTVEQM
ncbi:hypothetical protein [Luedemannella flava]|uniref:hypothetical protein n=1 Tax=Luedemannella flava TaxID=349316 RepID=UPI0031D0145E